MANETVGLTDNFPFAIAGDIQIKILNNVWCVRCRKGSSIGNLTGKIESGMLVLRGICTKCGGDVARVIENG